jgi:predicted nuclease of predicted toxin-antitoxin system
MKFLIDHNLGGHAEILLGSLASQGWVDLLSIQFFTFQEMELPINSSDRIVWRLAQAHQMMILTLTRHTIPSVGIGINKILD